MIVSMRVDSIGLDRSKNTPVVVLKEAEGERILPIWIGPSEASAIAARLQHVSVDRPLTHDLLYQMMTRLRGTLESVTITHDGQKLYFAELLVKHDGESVRIDARPSDSIALALSADAKILVADELLRTSADTAVALEALKQRVKPPEGPEPEGSA
jgi:bifunctional DNase/RNase